jgi:hypothetical protein
MLILFSIKSQDLAKLLIMKGKKLKEIFTSSIDKPGLGGSIINTK